MAGSPRPGWPDPKARRAGSQGQGGPGEFKGVKLVPLWVCLGFTLFRKGLSEFLRIYIKKKSETEVTKSVKFGSGMHSCGGVPVRSPGGVWGEAPSPTSPFGLGRGAQRASPRGFRSGDLLRRIPIQNTKKEGMG